MITGFGYSLKGEWKACCKTEEKWVFKTIFEDETGLFVKLRGKKKYYLTKEEISELNKEKEALSLN